jgi:uncharacterized RDD family membrane protein YckC
MQPGWYYAQGDAPGTQRYWDGTQWVGGPQPVGGVVDGGGAGTVTGGRTPAEWGQRFVAWLIDAGIGIAINIVFIILVAVGSAISSGLGSAINIIGTLVGIGFGIWNVIIRQGQMGQTLGKTQQNLMLVRDDTGEPVGIGMALVRAIVGSVLFFLCVIPGILDYLWPLWDDEKKRLTDKILNLSVVNA